MVFISESTKRKLSSQAKEYKSWDIEELRAEDMSLSDQIEEMDIALTFNPGNTKLEFKLRCFQYMKKSLNRVLMKKIHGGAVDDLNKKIVAFKNNADSMNRQIANLKRRNSYLESELEKIKCNT